MKIVKMLKYILLSIVEINLNNAKTKLDDAVFNIRIFSDIDNNKKKIKKITKSILIDEHEYALENYLNIIDRLSFLILKVFKNDKEIKDNYHNYIKLAIDTYPEEVKSRKYIIKLIKKLEIEK